MTSCVGPATSGAPTPFVSASYGPPLSLTVGAMTYGMNGSAAGMHPPLGSVSEASGGAGSASAGGGGGGGGGNGGSDAFGAFSASHLASQISALNSGGSKSGGGNTSVSSATVSSATGSEFFPMWMTPPTSGHSAPSHSKQQRHAHPHSGGIVNPEAYCDLCQKEFCNKYFLKRHKAKLMHKLSVQAPPKITVEKYLIEIAKYYNVDYEPDPQIMSQDEMYSAGKYYLLCLK